jgi:hypothetical protein
MLGEGRAERLWSGFNTSLRVWQFILGLVTLLIAADVRVDRKIERHARRPHASTAREFVRTESFEALERRVDEIGPLMRLISDDIKAINGDLTMVRENLAKLASGERSEW